MLELESKAIMNACSKCFKEHGFICAGKLTQECNLGLETEPLHNNLKGKCDKWESRNFKNETRKAIKKAFPETLKKCYHLRTYEEYNSDNETAITRLICADCGKTLKETIEYGNFRNYKIGGEYE